MPKAERIALNFYRKTARFRKGKAFDESLNAARIALGDKPKKKERQRNG